MEDLVTKLETDTDTRVMVLTDAGETWCAGQGLKEFFRDLDDKPAERRQTAWASSQWRWHKLYTFPMPTIAMVNGYCFRGAFTALVACDFAIAPEDATFGLSEINRGIFPGGHGHQSSCRGHALHHDGRPLRWKAGVGHAPGDLGGASRPAKGRNGEAGPQAYG